MRFLCLPGAYGSAKNFGVQLGPFSKHMEDRGLATFAFSQGEHEVEPPLGWENYFGSRPLYRFIDSSEGDAFAAIRRVRHIPRGLSPEDTLRLFSKNDEPLGFRWQTFREALDRLFKTIDEDPEIDGLIGYSEGAMMAASICAEENRRWEEKGVPRRIKFAIFFAGSPPLVSEGDGFVAKLADEHGISINIPTFHVFGSNDPLVYSSVALYNSCNQDTAQLYDHGLGHLVPRDADNVEQLGDTLSDVITKINKTGESEGRSNGKRVSRSGSGAETPVSVFTADEYNTSSSAGSAASSAGSTAESDLDSRSSHGVEVDGIAKIQVK
ncbi:serine hydrolase-domain-containing protein [Annulohypoxylon maeteangense]|uniref:serine hydrolase-domain-containing protein n=1 Tax=Annulohypoxylon maeteangense TaxID=1927788 RepID=UPI0020081778|nr:serine hydrolase-domain-containing protein [Annulohypoxylon maeteangense]KAI0885679.1 serine hydrolase-domain-containing protein [Annulohypoxylon maeteangense]